MKLIDKSALVAEMQKRRSKNAKNKLNLAASFEDNYLLSFIDTLEVKEVDDEPECRIFPRPIECYSTCKECPFKAQKGE